MTRVLVVDDHDDNLYLLEIMLHSQGYDVQTARNGVEALKVARSATPDLVITDILMPGMDGFSLCRAWMADDGLRRVPLVFYTATYTDPQDEAFALSLGAARFVVKPMEPVTFIELVRQVLSESAARQSAAVAPSSQEAEPYYQQYSQVLIRKLEDKMTQLEATNRALELNVAERRRMEEQIRRHAEDLEQRVAERTAELAETAARLAEREATLREANERLTEMDRMKSQFVANVSHELRTPLANIKLYLQLLDAVDPEKRRRYMATLVRETELLQSLIEGLLQLSRLDLGKVEPVLRPCDLVKLVAQLVEDRAAMARQKGLTLQAEIARDLPPILGDSRMLLQVFSNLITNALNYTPAGGSITVTVDRHTPPANAPDERCIMISVRDSGFGITPEDLPHLFERFYRGEAARLSQAAGTGLGLCICDEIVKRHGGHVEVASQIGAGSAFTVWLPVGGPP